MNNFPEDLTAESLLEWQAVKEAGLERALLDHTGRALSAIVDQALSFSLTAASARHLWEEAVAQSLADLALQDDRLLLEILLEANIGDEAYEVVQELLAQAGRIDPVTEDERRTELLEALDLSSSLVAAGNIAKFWSEDNWIEQTGTGHLPPYIRDIADALMERGYGESRAIATAVNTVKRWAKGGPARQGGPGNVTKETQAKAIKALVEWEAKRVEAKTNSLVDLQVFVAGKWQPALDLQQEKEDVFAWLFKKTVLKWKTKIKRAVRTGFTGLVGRITLAEMRLRGIQTKTWVTKRDDRVRDSHEEAEGQTVAIDQEFRVGYANLKYPGERSGPIEETANCRCVIVPGGR